MTLDLQFKLKSEPIYLDYLHTHSYWYKFLNRNPDIFNEYVKKLREDYHLRPIDKINKTIDTFEMISSIISSMQS